MYLSVLWLFLMFFFALSQNSSSDKKVYKIISVDKLEMKKQQNYYVVELYGNLRFVVDDIFFKSDNGIFDENEELFNLNGNVEAEMDSIKILSENSLYKRKENNIYLWKNVHCFTTNEYNFYTDSLIYDRQNCFLEAFGDNRGTDSLLEYSFSCGYIAIWQNDKKAILNENPTINAKHKARDIMISGKEFQIYSRENRVYGFGNIEIKVDSLEIKSNTCIYDKNLDRLILQGNVTSYLADNYLKGNIFEIFLGSNYIDSIVVFDDGELSYINKDTLKDVVQQTSFYGEEIKIFFIEENKIDRILIKNDVRNHYIDKDGKRLKTMVNDVKGEYIKIKLEDNKIKYIDINNNIVGRLKNSKKK